MAVNMDYIEERLRAYILPRKPETSAQEEAFENAVAAQAAYEEISGIDNIPAGVTQIRNDGVQMTLAAGANAGAYTRDSISPAAWAYLRNAGLIAYALPTAKKP